MTGKTKAGPSSQSKKARVSPKQANQDRRKIVRRSFYTDSGAVSGKWPKLTGVSFGTFEGEATTAARHTVLFKVYWLGYSPYGMNSAAVVRAAHEKQWKYTVKSLTYVAPPGGLKVEVPLPNDTRVLYATKHLDALEE